MVSAILLVYLVGFVDLGLCQNSTASRTSAGPSIVTASGSSHATHIVTVGKLLNQFDPDSLTAKVGDVIQFAFYPTNHSVGRAEYHQACIPYEDTGEKKIGFWSGFFPVDKVLPNPPTWNLTINHTDPVFFYCAAPGSCINYQMVGLINPNESVSLARQKQDASNAQYMLAPGQPFPSEDEVPAGDVNPEYNEYNEYNEKASGNSSSSSSSSSTSSPSAQATKSFAAIPSHTPAESSQKLSTGAIVGIVIAGVVVAILVGALFFLLGRQKTILQFMRRGQYQVPGAQNLPGDQPGMTSPQPHMASFPSSPGLPYSDTLNYHKSALNTPPYTREVAQDPLAARQPPLAELPSPGEKHLQEYISSNSSEMQQRPQEPYQDSRAPTPQPQARPLSFWGRSRSHKTPRSELSAESLNVGRSPNLSSSGYQSER